MGALIAARAAQGLGAALLMPCSLALIIHTFPAGSERRGALAAWGGISAVGLSIGPVLGGALVDSVGWRFIFLINLPLAVLAGLAVAAYVTETTRHRHPFDIPGQVLVVAALGCLSGGFIVAGEFGWDAPGTIGLLVAGRGGGARPGPGGAPRAAADDPARTLPQPASSATSSSSPGSTTSASTAPSSASRSTSTSTSASPPSTPAWRCCR